MKYLQRFLLLLFALVMCVGLFSITAHAKDLTTQDFEIDIAFAGSSGSGLGFYSTPRFSALDRTFGLESGIVTGNFNSSVFISSVANIYSTDGTYIINQGEKFTYNLSNFQFSFWNDTISSWVDCMKFDVMKVTLIYDNDSFKELTPEYTYNSSRNTSSFSGKGTADRNVRAIKLDLMYYPTKRMGIQGNWIYKYAVGVSDIGLSIDIQSEEAGLLEGIGNKLTSGFSALGDKLTGVFNSIVELPQKLWNLISDGLKNLFVPSEESMTAYKDKWDELLASRFGAVYQVVNIMTDSWDGIMQADETDTIEFPQASVNFSGTPFSFGGYSVKIVPDGFYVLVTAIKSIVAIVCTVAFVNGMRKRYDEIMGVE